MNKRSSASDDRAPRTLSGLKLVDGIKVIPSDWGRPDRHHQLPPPLLRSELIRLVEALLERVSFLRKQGPRRITGEAVVAGCNEDRDASRLRKAHGFLLSQE